MKCFLLQSMYNLSDPRLEEEIADRRSFQIFLGLGSGDAIPDETTICRYREMFARLGLDRQLFRQFNAQLTALGLIVGKGTIVDATLKQAQVFGGGRRDTDTRYTSRKGKMFYGYKGHVGLDAETEIVHTADFTPANVTDTEMFDAMLSGTERRVYADKGYSSRERRQRLTEQGVACGILFRAARAHPLTRHQQRQNKRFARIGSASRSVPSRFSNECSGTTAVATTTCIGIGSEFLLALMVYNIRRSFTLLIPRWT